MKCMALVSNHRADLERGATLKNTNKQKMATMQYICGLMGRGAHKLSLDCGQNKVYRKCNISLELAPSPPPPPTKDILDPPQVTYKT